MDKNIDINSVILGIMCNFSPACGEERTKEAVNLIKDMRDKLAAYEDTGLKPEEVDLCVKCHAQQVSKRELELSRENANLRGLLKLTFADINSGNIYDCDTCTYQNEEKNHDCGRSGCYRWQYADRLKEWEDSK